MFYRLFPIEIFHQTQLLILTERLPCLQNPLVSPCVKFMIFQKQTQRMVKLKDFADRKCFSDRFSKNNQESESTAKFFENSCIKVKTKQKKNR